MKYTHLSKEKRNLLIVILFLIIAFIALYLIAYHQFIVSGKMYMQSISDTKIDQLVDEYDKIENNTVVEKQFTATKNNLEKMIIYFSKNESTISASIDVNIKLTDLATNQIIAEDNVAYNTIRSNNNYEFIFEDQKNSKDKDYRLTITFTEIDKTELTLLYSDSQLQKNVITTVNGEKINGTFGINEYYISSARILKFNLISLGLGISLFVLALFIYTRKNLTVEKLFLYTCPIFLILFLVVMPMYSGHDETRHMLRAYEISEGHLLTEINDGVVGTSMPKSITNGTGKNWREGVTYSDIKDLLNKKIDDSEQKIPNMENVAVYSPIQYLPQSIGMFIANLLSDNVLVILYAARLCNLITCIITLYFAIKLIPFGKKLVYLIALLPLSMESFSTLSPDGITTSIVMLFIAYILNIIFNSNDNYKVKKKDIIILSILSIIIALCKIVYVPIVLLILLIPSSRYKSKKQKIITSIAIILIAFAINLAWLGISNRYLTITSDGSSTEKIITIIKSPINYLRMLFYTINYNGNTYIQGLFGSVLAMGEFVKLYTIVPLIYIMLFLFISCTDRELKNRFNWFQNLIMIIVACAIIGLIFTSLYIQSTDINSLTITGVQGRYFIPILLILGLLMTNLKINNDYSEKSKIKMIGIIACILQVYIILSVMITHI